MFASAVSMGLLAVLRRTVDREALMPWAYVPALCLLMAAVLLLFGGLARPLQKIMHHRFFETSEHYRTRLAVNPVLRWFWWLNREGHDRNA